MTTELPGKFDMILSADNPNYKDLPGLSVLLGGMWVMNISYWGFNQYIIQRALGAKSIREAQKGIVLAAFLKLLMPVIIVLPGIAAVMLAPGLARPDEAYPHLMAMLPSGILGLVFAALLAAIVASLGFEDQFDRHDLHDGPLPCREAGYQHPAASWSSAALRRSSRCSSRSSRRGRCSAASTRLSSTSRNSRASSRPASA